MKRIRVILFLVTVVLTNQVALCGEGISSVLVSSQGTFPSQSNVKEIDFITQNTIWEMGGLKFVEDADRLSNGNTLITDYLSNKVIEVDKDKNIVWEFDNLNGPFDADRLDNGNTIIADANNGRVIEVDSNKNIVWELTGIGRPVDVERLSNDNTLITDQNNRVIEVDNSKNIVWMFNESDEPIGAERLLNGNTLITDHSGNYVVEVNRSDNTVWDMEVNYMPGSAKRLANGNTLISVSTGGNAGVWLVDINGNIVWKYIDLNYPIDADPVYSMSSRIPAIVDVKPDTLNKASQGGIVTSYIEIPDYDVNLIDVNTVKLSTDKGEVSALLSPTEVGDYDSDGIPERMVEFDRQAFIGIVDVGDHIKVTISGKISGEIFEGSDEIRVKINDIDSIPSSIALLILLVMGILFVMRRKK